MLFSLDVPAGQETKDILSKPGCRWSREEKALVEEWLLGMVCQPVCKHLTLWAKYLGISESYVGDTLQKFWLEKWMTSEVVNAYNPAAAKRQSNPVRIFTTHLTHKFFYFCLSQRRSLFAYLNRLSPLYVGASSDDADETEEVLDFADERQVSPELEAYYAECRSLFAIDVKDIDTALTELEEKLQKEKKQIAGESLHIREFVVWEFLLDQRETWDETSGDRVRDIIGALGGLNPYPYVVLVFSCFYDLTREEIAEKLNIKSGAVRGCLSRAREGIRKTLRQKALERKDKGFLRLLEGYEKNENMARHGQQKAAKASAKTTTSTAATDHAGSN